MSNRFELTDETPVYVISVAAQLAGMHPQTLRQYDRLGLVSPDRAAGRGRRYSLRDIELLREVQRLSQEGVNLAGIKRLLALQQQVSRLAVRVVELEQELAAAHQALQRHGGSARRASGRPQAPVRDAAMDATALTLWRSRDI
ncbi:MAG TPA: helix-turn-helix transcriptional regulator [Streptosporangiales bacterium]